MPIVMQKAIHVCQLKVETTEGTDIVPGAGDSLQLLEPGVVTVGYEIANDRGDLLNGLLDEAQPLGPSALWFEYTGKVQLRGYGSAYSAPNKPEIDAVLQAIGMSSTGTFTGGSENYVYDTASSSMKTLSVYAYHGLETGVWVKHVGLACRVSKAEIEFPVGKPAVLTFTVRGYYVEPTDATPATPTYQSAVPPVFGGSNAFVLGSYAAPVCRSAKITIENSLAPRINANATTTNLLIGYLQTNRKITLEASLEAARISDYNAYNKWSQRFTDTVAIKHPGGAGGGTQYNRVAVDGGTFTLFAAPAYQDERGLWLRTLSGKLSPEAASRCKITFN